jgi:hypothetical protein
MAAAAKHTPGPWTAKWSKYREGAYIVQTLDPSNRVIASFDDDGDGAGEQSIADAHLISAAIELLAVCREFISVLGPDGYHPVAGKTATDRMRTAIAKAEGRA